MKFAKGLAGAFIATLLLLIVALIWLAATDHYIRGFSLPGVAALGLVCAIRTASFQLDYERGFIHGACWAEFVALPLVALVCTGMLLFADLSKVEFYQLLTALLFDVFSGLFLAITYPALHPTSDFH